jgi:3-dehydroquinate synthase
VIGVGGGAATDLSGFVAATYLRGIEAVYVPTTLLAAVDASIGGKTGVNVDGKNLVGVFAHPTRVVIDTVVLAEVDPAITRQGHAEAVKAGFIGEAHLLALYESAGAEADLGEIVAAAVRFKAEVVSDDWKETGRRAILNFGHTAGHAVEIAGGLAHGDAVAIGMRVAADLSQELIGFKERDRLVSLIERLGLPIEIPGLSVTALMELAGLDKKRDADGLRMVLLEDLGRPVVRHIEADVLAAAMVAAGAAEG